MSDVTIKMNNGMITTANYVLQQREIRGNKERRDHKRIMTALLEACSGEQEFVNPQNGEKSKQKITKEGPLTLERSDWETLYAYAEDKVKAGYPASLNDGMCDLLEGIEKIAKVEADKEEEGDKKVDAPKVSHINEGKKK